MGVLSTVRDVLRKIFVRVTVATVSSFLIYKITSSWKKAKR